MGHYSIASYQLPFCGQPAERLSASNLIAVSYTHLTLPTIYSV